MKPTFVKFGVTLINIDDISHIRIHEDKSTHSDRKWKLRLNFKSGYEFKDIQWSYKNEEDSKVALEKLHLLIRQELAG